MDGKQPLLAHMSVDLGGLHARMPEQLLHHPQVCPPVEEVGGEGVAERVGVRRDRRPADHQAVDIAGTEAPPVPVQEQGIGRSGLVAHQQVPVPDPPLDRPGADLVHGQAAAAPAFSEDRDGPRSDIDVAELYDCYTYTVVVSLEDYGFCQKGEGGAYVSSGAIGPEGSLKLNTGGGQLSSYYMWGMTPLSEAVIQVRGEGGDRQVHPHELALVSGNGGILDHHATLVLGSGPA